MSTARLLLASSVLAFCVGCSGGDGGGGGGGGTLTTGVYLVTSVNESSDGCGVGPAVSVNDTMSVTISGNSIAIGSTVDGSIDGSDIEAPDQAPLEQETNSGADSCSATTRDDFSGTVTGDDEFRLVEEYERTVSNPGSWSGCPYSACSSRFTYEAAK